ncbi:hypothetical protein LCGC14_2207610 [marine sediment metagenome]|uniref:Uncharacterized protein n=1 Tax=marine sediment metagenome TaxID=412755 RepID=A0A0F9DEY2_9ZZZZ
MPCYIDIMKRDGELYIMKYRGCLKDCKGCIHQVKAETGREHGCNVPWAGRIVDGVLVFDRKQCPIYLEFEASKPIGHTCKKCNTLISPRFPVCLCGYGEATL